MDVLQGLSRRKFLEASAFSIAFASSVAANELDPSGCKDCADSSAPVPPATPIATKTDAANYLTVAARVNGRGPYRFIIDTGANRTILATEVAVELGLLRGERVILDGVVRTILADTVSIRELTLGSITRRI